MKRFIFAALLLGARMSYAVPLIDRIVPTGGEPVKVYPDDRQEGLYWYIPTSIEPWKTSDRNYQNKPYYREGRSFNFAFKGQASVDRQVLQRVAKALRTDISRLSAIAYDKSENMICQNVFVEESISWLFPSRIGNYLEVVPVTIRSTDSRIVDELYHMVTAGGGLACTVDVWFKAAATGYMLKLTANMNTVYERFEAGAHAEYFWWEVDIHTMIQKLVREGVIRLEKIEDVDAPKTPLDAQIQASYNEIVKLVTAMLFKPVLKLPEGALPDRGKPFSLRVDYQRSEEQQRYTVELDSRNISNKQTQISLRIATDNY